MKLNTKILLITVRGDFGGGPKHVDQIISGLNSEFDLFVAAPKGDPFGDAWAQSSVLKGFIELPYRRFSFTSLFRVVKFISINEIGIVHSHGNGAGFYSRLIKAFKPSLYVIHTFHGVADVYDSALKRLVYKISGRLFKFFTDWSVFVSEGEKELGLKYGFAKEGWQSVVYNGIDPILSNSPIAFLPNKVFKVVTLSRFDYQKNMHLAYGIAKKLAGHKDIKFVWVGDGPDYEELFSLSQNEGVNNIDFIGFSKFPQAYLAEASLYLSTSRFEGLPYGLIEASASGLPIVATNVRGNNEVAIDGQNAILVENVDQAAKAILEFQASEQKYIDASRTSLEIFKNKFELSKMLNSLKLLYLTAKSK